MSLSRTPVLLLPILLLAYSYDFNPDEEIVFSFEMKSVKIDVLQRGDDCTKKAEDGDMLTAEFHGFLESTKEPFESSADNGKPSSFKLGHGYMIKGLERGLQNICVGEKRRIHIPAQLGYGRVGDGKNVPPGANLVYDVQVIHIQKGEMPPDIFAKIDMNGDKKISRDEMANFILETGRTVTLRGQSEINNVVDEIFTLEDLNEDGFVDFNEFSGPKHGKHDEL